MPIKLLVLVATLSVGIVHEEDGVVRRTFWIYNQGADSIRVTHVWTSCGCTTAAYDSGRRIGQGDSVAIELAFDPTGKGGEFMETARVQIVSDTDTTWQDLALEGEIVSAAHSIQRAYPVRVGNLRLSTTQLDFGEMKRGESKQMQVAVYGHGAIPVTLKADEGVGWGAQTLSKTIVVDGEKVKIGLKVCVVDNVAMSGRLPVLQTERRLTAGTTSITLRNTGNAPLIVHRIYSEMGDLVSKDLIIDKEPLIVKLPQKWKEGTEDLLLTIITNDPQHLRTTVRMKRK